MTRAGHPFASSQDLSAMFRILGLDEVTDSSVQAIARSNDADLVVKVPEDLCRAGGELPMLAAASFALLLLVRPLSRPGPGSAGHDSNCLEARKQSSKLGVNARSPASACLHGKSFA